MRLESIDEILSLRDQRATAVKLRDGAFNGSLGNFDIWIEGDRFQILGVINEQYLRAAISYNAEALVDAIDKRLAQLGVSMPRLERSEPPTVESAMAEVKMYQTAWVRELGGSIRNKRHFIDALVLTTREMRAKADRFREDVIAKAEHDRRVTELLQHNNKMEDRMRAAERKLKRFMDGTPSDRLAFAVEQAAASTIAAIKEDSKC